MRFDHEYIDGRLIIADRKTKMAFDLSKPEETEHFLELVNESMAIADKNMGEFHRATNELIGDTRRLIKSIDERKRTRT
jgi:hypothetical protein